MGTQRRVFLGLLVGSGMTTICRAQAPAEVAEYRIKAAFVCKFANYVEWPAPALATADSPITIGALAPDAVIDELSRTAAGVSAGARALAVRRWRRDDSMAGLHILFVSRAEDLRLAETLSRVGRQPVLVVTESKPFPPGSMINFVIADDKVRFDIAPQAAEASGLRISARLLGVARDVLKGP